MPTYQYACTECGHQLEAVQSFSDEPLTVCTECQGRLRKVFSSVGVVFKGSGFYRTDSRAAAGSADGSQAPSSTEKSTTPAASATKGSDGSPGPSSSAVKSSKGTPPPSGRTAASA